MFKHSSKGSNRISRAKWPFYRDLLERTSEEGDRLSVDYLPPPPGNLGLDLKNSEESKILLFIFTKNLVTEGRYKTEYILKRLSNVT